MLNPHDYEGDKQAPLIQHKSIVWNVQYFIWEVAFSGDALNEHFKVFILKTSRKLK